MFQLSTLINRSLVLVFGMLPECGEDHSCLANNGAICTFLSTGLLLVTITLMAMGSRLMLSFYFLFVI